MFGCPIIAKYLRIRPVDWRNHITLRFEVLGCPSKSGNKPFVLSIMILNIVIIYLSLINHLSLSLDPYGVCPQGWKERPGSDTCYLITTRDAKTFDDARQTCRLQQGDLLVVNDVQEAVRKINY